MKKWPLIVMAAAVLAAGLLIGRFIIPGSDAPAAASAQDASQSTWDKVKDSGVLTIGIGEDAPPYEYLQNGQPIGYDVDIARAVGQRLSAYAGRTLRLEFVPVTDEDRITWVQTGQVDMSLAHTNITRTRLENIDFSLPYGWDGKAILYLASDGTRDLASFAGKAVGFKISSSSVGEIKAYYAARGWKLPDLVQFDNYDAGIQALLNKQIQGFTDDTSLIKASAISMGYKVGPGGTFYLTEPEYSATYYGIGVRQNDSLWRNEVNYALQDLWKDGEFQKIYNKWFGPHSSDPIPLGNNHIDAYVVG